MPNTKPAKKVESKAKPAEKPVEAAPEPPKPEFAEFPKMLYRTETVNRTVASAEEQAEAEKDGWKDHQ